MQLVLFGFAINNDPKSLPAALVATSNDRYTRAMVSALQNTGYYRFDHVVGTAAEAELLMAQGDVAFVVTIPADFARRVERGDNPQILIEADATDPSVSSGAISTLNTLASPRAAARAGHGGGGGRERRGTARRSWCTGATIRKASRNTTSCPACSASSCR